MKKTWEHILIDSYNQLYKEYNKEFTKKKKNI